MKEVDARYGPLEWRLPEAHAIYWASVGLRECKLHPEKINPDDTITLHRLIYQSMHQSTLHGWVVFAPKVGRVETSANLDILKKTSDAYEEAVREEPESKRDGIRRAHRNLIREAVYQFYVYDRMREAGEWYDYLAKKFPKDDLIGGIPGSSPLTMSLDDYALARVQDEISDPSSQDRIRMILFGLVQTSLFNRALGNDDKADGYEKFAQKLYGQYLQKTASGQGRTAILSLDQIKQNCLRVILDPERGLNPELADRLRTSLNLPAPTNAPPATAP
jgi:hypothetical protein